jgi:branched-chain amino acid transport system ATP-binding protein
MINMSGELHFGGQRIDTLVTEEIVRLGVAHVPDGRGTFTGLTTEENLRLGAYSRHDKSSQQQDLEKMYGYFPKLRERKLQQAGTLSGGEQQRVSLARAFVQRPALLFADEPTGSLDHATGARVIEMLFSLYASLGTTLVLVTHDPQLAARCDRQLLLQAGRLA